MSDGGRVSSSSAAGVRPATPGPAPEVARREDAASKSKPGTLRRFLDYREDIIDGFAIASFSNAKELESFVSSQRSESVNRSESSTLSVEPSDSPAPPPTLDPDVGGFGHGDVSPRQAPKPPTTTTTSAPSSAPCLGRKQCQPPPKAQATAATETILHLPAHSVASSAPQTRSSATLADDKPSARPPGALFAAAAAAAGALAMTRLSASVDGDLCPERALFADSRPLGDDDGKTAQVPPPKKMLLAAGRADAKASRCPSEAAWSLKTISSADLAGDDDDDGERGRRLRGQGSPAKWSANDDLSESKLAEYEGRRKVHSTSEPRDHLTYAELSKIGSYLKTSTSLANYDIKEEEFHKKDVDIRCCNNSSLTAVDISPNVMVDSKIPDLLLPHQPLDQKPSRSSSSRPATSSPQKPDCKAEGFSANQSPPPPSTVNPESGIFKKSGIVSSHVSLSSSLSSSLQAKRSSCVVAHVSSSSSLPERGSVIVRECSSHQRSSSNSTVKRECRSPLTPAHKPAVRQLSETRAPAVNAGLPHSSAAVNPFPLFPLFDMDPSSIVASHPVYFPAVAHPAAYASNFSASGLPFGLPPFQRSGMFAPSLGFPPSNLMTSPLMGLSGHYHPEMMSLSSTPSPEMLTRLQQELNTRFLQDRGLLPTAPFTLHAEMHQHQHLHHHQHLLPGSYLPHPSFPPDALSLGKLPPGGGLLQSSQNLADFIDREQLTKASGLGAFSGLGCLSMVGGLAAPLPFGSGLSGAFQPKSGLSSLNLTPASQLLLSLRDRDPFLAAVNQLPQLAKKRGQWCSAHVQTAWKIYKMKCHLVESDKNLNSLKLHQTDPHSLVLPTSGNRLLLGGDRLRPSAIIDSVFSPFGRQTNFSGYDGLDLPYARKIAYDAAALSPNVLRPSSDWNGLPSGPPPHPPPPPLALQPSASLLVPGSWPKSGSNCSSRSNIGLNVGSLERSNDYRERSLVTSHKADNRITGKESHKSSSRPPSNTNSVSSEHRRTPSGLTHKGNGHFRSRSRSPLKFSASRSTASLNGLTKDPRADEEILWKPDVRMDNFPKIRSHESAGYPDPGKSTEPGHHRSDLFRLPRTRDPVSAGVPEHEQPNKESTIFADCPRHKNPPPFHAKDFYAPDVYKASGGRLFSHHSPLQPGALLPPLVGGPARSPPSPISAIKNNRVHNGWSISVSSSAGLIDIQNDSGLILR